MQFTHQKCTRLKVQTDDVTLLKGRRVQWTPWAAILIIQEGKQKGYASQKKATDDHVSTVLSKQILGTLSFHPRYALLPLRKIPALILKS
eukprot:1136498-Pelagomonas_calceolata.AAC.1